jgi:hypothetical protein
MPRRVARRRPTPRSVTPEQAKAPAREPLTPLRVLLTAGAVAGALGSILGLPPAVRALFSHPKPMLHLTMRSARTMTFGQSRHELNGTSKGYDKRIVALHGALISYDVVAKHFHNGDKLPRRLTVRNVTHGGLRTVPTVPLTVTSVTSCGCATWVPAPRRGDQYEVALAIYAPGTVGTDSPLKRDRLVFAAR